MNVETRKPIKSETEGFFDSSLLLMTVLVYSVGTVVYLWGDFVKVYSWMIA